jgi:predicted site-specific integrase-resolvase
MIDYEFVTKMLEKQRKHLGAVYKSISSQLEDYDRQITSLDRLLATGNMKYRERRKELEFKRTEALEKLANVEENYKRIGEQLLEEEFKPYVKADKPDEGFARE